MMRAIRSYLVLASLSLGLACGHVHPGPVLSCLEQLAPGLLHDAVTEIYAVIEAGITGGDTEATILAALANLSLRFGPDIYHCAMQFVSAPDVGPEDLKAARGPNATAAAAIAAEYLAEHP